MMDDGYWNIEENEAWSNSQSIWPIEERRATCISSNGRLLSIQNIGNIHPKPTAINVDGENIGSTPLKMEVMPSALKIIR